MDHKSSIYELDINIVFSYMARTRKTREQSDGIKDKLKNAPSYISNKQIICYILSLYVFALFQNTSLLRTVEN